MVRGPAQLPGPRWLLTPFDLLARVRTTSGPCTYKKVPETETRREIDRRLVLVLKRQGMRRVLLLFRGRRSIPELFCRHGRIMCLKFLIRIMYPRN